MIPPRPLILLVSSLLPIAACGGNSNGGGDEGADTGADIGSAEVSEDSDVALPDSDPDADRDADAGDVAADVADGDLDAGSGDLADAADVSDTEAGGCSTAQAEAMVAVVRTGCRAIFDAFPDGIPENPVEILGAVEIHELCSCAEAFRFAQVQCSFEEMVANGLDGVPASLISYFPLAATVCGASDEPCPTAEDFETDDIDPVRDFWSTQDVYAHVPASTLGSYEAWPCYAFYEAYADPEDPAQGIVDYPWMWNAETSHWDPLPLSTFTTVTPGHFDLKYQNSETTLGIFMWRGGETWYFDYYCFEGADGNMLSEHLEVIAVTGDLPEGWQDVVVEKMGRRGYDASTRLIPRVIDFAWECPATIPFPDPNGE